MRYMLFPGFSKSNREWACDLKDYFQQKGLDLHVVSWLHWQQEKASFNINQEAQRVVDITGDSEATIIAKSIGTELAAYLISQNLIKVHRLILLGIPSRSELYKEALSQFDPTKVTVIQNSQDPKGYFSDVERFIHSINPEIKVIEKKSSNHSYPYNELIYKLASQKIS